MATIYINDETREILDTLVVAENRSLSDEVDFLCVKRIKELGLPDMNLPSVGGNIPKQDCKCNRE